MGLNDYAFLNYLTTFDLVIGVENTLIKGYLEVVNLYKNSGIKFHFALDHSIMIPLMIQPCWEDKIKNG